MQTALRKMGNSTGMILPKPILTALGVASGARLDLEVDNGRVIATPVKRTVRDGWEDGAKAIAAAPLSAGDSAWLDTGSDADAHWEW